MQLLSEGEGHRSKQSLGFFYRNGKIWVELIDGVDAKELQPRIVKQVKQGSIIFSDTLRGHTGITAKGHVYRLVNHATNTTKKGIRMAKCFTI